MKFNTEDRVIKEVAITLPLDEAEVFTRFKVDYGEDFYELNLSFKTGEDYFYIEEFFDKLRAFVESCKSEVTYEV